MNILEQVEEIIQNLTFFIDKSNNDLSNENSSENKNSPENKNGKELLNEENELLQEELDDIANILRENDKYLGERIDDVSIKPIDDGIILGIDLGTSNSCISIWRNNKLEVIPDNGNLTIPSIVSFGNYQRYIGLEAKNQMELNGDNTYYQVKRLIGRDYNDRYVQLFKKYLTYEIVEGNNRKIFMTSTKGKRNKYSPEEISAMILFKLKSMAEQYLKQEIKKVVITVPAYFNDTQREATKDAAQIAGLECVRIINEPTAAALAYGYIKSNREKSIIMVYDLGGGTLDVSIMELDIKNNVFKVLASVGNSYLGGADFDTYIYDYCVNEFMKKNKLEKLESISALSLQLLKKRCEYAKKNLSSKKQTTIAVKNFHVNQDLIVNLTRSDFENICSPLFILCMRPIDDALKSCTLEKTQIDDIILVGGCTRIPKIKENIKQYFGGKDPNDGVNPDIVVSAGAAIQGYMLSNNDIPYSDKVTLLDIVPLSLGVETMRSIMTTIIPRNSIIPIKKTKRFCPDEDYQTSITIKVYEGERKLTKDNYFIGSFELKDLFPAPKELQEILVTFNVDFNGIIDVTAIDKRREENSQTIRITSNKGKLSQEEIDGMIKESMEWELSDKLLNEICKFKFELKDLCNTIIENCNDQENKIEGSENIINEMKNILSTLDNDDRDYLQSTLKKIRNTYGILILKRNKTLLNVKEAEESNLGVSVFNDIEQSELYSNNLTDEEKQKLFDIREELVTTCYSINNIISDIKIPDDDKQLLIGTIDDILLWVHVTEKANIDEYKLHLQKINDLTDDLLGKYPEMFTSVKPDINREKKSLNTLCYSIKCAIEDKTIVIDNDNIMKIIDDTLIWLQTEHTLDEYVSKKIHINNVCSNVHA